MAPLEQTFATHLSDLSHWLYLTCLVASVKQAAYRTRPSPSSSPAPPSAEVPFTAILILSLGSFVHAAGYYFPGSPFLAEAVKEYLALTKANPEASAGNVIVHIATNSEDIFQTILVGIQLVIGLALIIQSFISAVNAKRIGIKQTKPNVRLGFGGVALWIICALAVAANVHAITRVPKVVKASSLAEFLPLIPKCLPQRFGLFSLVETVALLTLTGSSGKRVSNVDGALAFKCISLAFFVLGLAMKFEFDVNRAIVKGSLTHNIHMGLVGLQGLILLGAYLPTLVSKNFFLTTGLFLVVGVTSGFLLSDDYSGLIESKHLGVLNAVVLASASLSTILGGSASCLALVLVSSAITRVHEDLVTQFL